MGLNKKTSMSIIWLVGCLMAVGLLSACSDVASDEENLDAEKNGNQSNLGQDDAAEGNGQENFVDAGNSGGDGAEVNSDTSAGCDLDFGASANNAPANFAPANFAPTNNVASAELPTNSSGNLTAGVNPSTNNSGNALLGSNDLSTPTNSAVNQTAPATNISQENAANSGNTANVAKTPEPMAPASSGGLTPRSNGRVRYVKEGGVQIKNAPNGSPVMNLEQGDHPVTWEENGMLKVADGLYVPVDGMSDKGVGRSRGARVWGQ
jgi:hypothetical protein